MRVVAGKFGGRKIAAPTSDNIRPTSDRVRESLFSILASKYPGSLQNARVIDLFAGTGALGLEALSRGADFALFVDASREGQTLIHKNIENLKVKEQTAMRLCDATKLGSIGKLKPFDLAFVDPPYGKGLVEISILNLTNGGWLTPNAILVVEDRVGSSPPVLPSFIMLDERKFGDTSIRFMKSG